MNARSPQAIVEAIRDVSAHIDAVRKCHPLADHVVWARALLCLGCTALRRSGASYETFVAEVAGAWEASAKVEAKRGLS